MRQYCFLILLSILSVNCSKDGGNPGGGTNPNAVIPLVTTTSTVTIYNINSASSGGTVVNDGGATITARGVCWAAHSSPTLADNVYNSGLGSGTGTFGASMNNLTPGATYFVKAFATNSVGTGYGSAVMFTVTTTGPPATDVYAAGDLDNGIFTAPTIWKNGVPSPLTTGINPAHANAVFFSAGNDTYVTGYERNGTVNMARVWRNSAGTFLTNGVNGAGTGRSVYASGADVYVAGETSGATPNTQATLWRNGSPSYLTNGTSAGAAHSVSVSGGVNVYVAGVDGNMAKVWLNGSTIFTTNGTNAAIAYCVSPYLPDWYAAGSEMIGSKSAAVLWKNGSPSYLTNGTNNAVAFSVYVVYNLGTGTDIYVAGYEHNGTKNVAKIWKNGVPTSLTDGSRDAMAYSVHGTGPDIYVGGYEHDGTKNVAKVWKNGLEIFLQNSTNTGLISGVFVK